MVDRYKQALYIIMLCISSIGLMLNVALCIRINLRRKNKNDAKITTQYLLGNILTSLAYVVGEATKISPNCQFYRRTRLQCMQLCPELSLLTLGEPMSALAILTMAAIFYNGRGEDLTALSKSKRATLYVGPLLTAILFALTTWTYVMLQRPVAISSCCNVFVVWTKAYYRGYYILLSVTGFIAVALFVLGIFKNTKRAAQSSTEAEPKANSEEIIVLCFAVGLHAVIQSVAGVYSKVGGITRLLLRHVWVIDALSFTFYPLYSLIADPCWKSSTQQNTQ